MQFPATLALALASIVPSAQEAASGPEAPRPLFLWQDVDADGRPDLYTLQPGRDDVLLRNLDDGRLADETVRAGLAGLRSRSVLLEDLDGDGRVDLVSVGRDGTPRLFRSIGDGAFEETTSTAGLEGLRGVVGAGAEDVDGDGRADLWLESADGTPHVLLQRPGGAFEPLRLELPAPLADVVVADPPVPTASAPEVSPHSAGREAPSSPTGDRVPLPVDVALAGMQSVAAPPPPAPSWSATPIFPPACVESLADAAGAGCVTASSVPALGSLYPLSSDLYVEPGTGHVGIGTTTPDERLSVGGHVAVAGVLRFGSPFSSIYFPQVPGGSNPMIFTFDVGTGPVNNQRMILARSPSDDEEGLFYEDARRNFIFQTDSTAPVLSIDLLSKNVGIGVRNPAADLHLDSAGGLEVLLEADIDNGGGESQHPAVRFSQDGGIVQTLVGFQDGQNDFAIRNLYSDGGLRFDLHTSTNRNWEFRRRSSTATDVEARITRPGSLQLDGSVSSPAADLAEFYPVLGAVEPGEVVCFSGDGLSLERARPGAGARLAGVISSRPAFTMGLSYTEEDEPGVEPEPLDDDERFGGDTSELRVDRAVTHEIEVNRRAPLALAGRVPVKVTAANGPIEPGDLLSLSSLPGHATKATEAGVVIGTALQPWHAGEGKILAFVRTGWYAPGADADVVASLQHEVSALRSRVAAQGGEMAALRSELGAQHMEVAALAETFRALEARD